VATHAGATSIRNEAGKVPRTVPSGRSLSTLRLLYGFLLKVARGQALSRIYPVRSYPASRFLRFEAAANTAPNTTPMAIHKPMLSVAAPMPTPSKMPSAMPNPGVRKSFFMERTYQEQGSCGPCVDPLLS
jgi:hypothetical protein